MQHKLIFAGLTLILHLYSLIGIFAFGSPLHLKQNGSNSDEGLAKRFLEDYNKEYGRLFNLYIVADWDYNTNLTEENFQAVIEAGLVLSSYSDAAYAHATTFDPFNFTEDTKRQLFYVGKKSLSDEEMKNLSGIISSMGSIYGQGKVCRESESNGEGDECLYLEPELTELLSHSRNASELLWAWEGWRTNVARPIRPLYLQYVELKNKLAVINGYSDFGDELRQKYEDPEFESDIIALYNELKPLYLQLHAYMRRKLYQTYGPEVVDITGPLPQHILGDMWGRFWVNLNSIGVPYPDEPSLEFTSALVVQNYSIKRMFEAGEDFYTSMGLLPLPPTFYNLSLLEKPDDREVICHPRAWEFMDGKDFREGANEGFHEAIGELMSMCVSTPKHLHSIGLLDELPSGDKTTINFLFRQSLLTISSLPFHLLQDTWLWGAFRGDFGEVSSYWNEEYWRLSEEIVGVKSPVPRNPQEDLDITSIFHIIADAEMIRYYVRTILQFQFAEALCATAGHEGDLHDCDFYGSIEAGEKLSEMLQLGRSMPWPDALEALTGVRKMNATALRKYFEPLEQWLTDTNAVNGDIPGWTTSTGVRITL